GEQNHQHHGEEEARYGNTDDDDTARPDIESAAVAHGLANTERDRDQVSEQRRPRTERNRHRQLLDDQVRHLAISKEAVAEVEGEIVAHHHQKALGRRLVEAVEPLELLEGIGIDATRRPRLLGTANLHSRSDRLATAAADPRRSADRTSLELGHELVDR